MFLDVLAKTVADACGRLWTIQRVTENPRGGLVEESSQNAQCPYFQVGGNFEFSQIIQITDM